jgi:hypothetical protein
LRAHGCPSRGNKREHHILFPQKLAEGNLLTRN